MRRLALLLVLLAAPAGAEEMAVQVPGARLAATLDLPDAARFPPPRPAALLIAGSGPTDRDGNGPPALLNTDAYLKLGRVLAGQGIAVLRPDKRGIGASEPGFASEAELRFHHFVDDAVAWATALSARADTGPVTLIGHSEGALIVTLAAAALAEAGTPPAALVLVAGPGEPVGDTLRRQLATLEQPLRDSAYATIAKLEAGELDPDAPPQLAAIFRPDIQPYLVSWMRHDPAALLAALPAEIPVLIVQGGRDLQVGPRDAEMLAAARPSAVLAPFQEMNHVLTDAPTERMGNLLLYVTPDAPLTAGLAEAIGGFILDAAAR